MVVAGAGGFIGGHLVRSLLDDGASVRAVDVKPATDWHQRFDAAENRELDLSTLEGCRDAVRDASEIYNLASDMGGMGFIELNRARCMLSVLINTHLLQAAKDARVERYFFSSSACVYPVTLQDQADVKPLAECDVYPAMPEDGYGWEKLFGERMCRSFSDDFGLQTRVARYHNVYGPFGTWTGGREKAPAAICRKVAEAKLSGRHEIEIWGDGRQTRSFLWIDDCIEGTRRLMHSDVGEPLNVGSEEIVTVNDLVTLVEELAGIQLERRYVPSAPRGVMGRNSDNTRIRRELGWAPTTSLRTGMEKTWAWIFEQVRGQVPSLRGVASSSGDDAISMKSGERMGVAAETAPPVMLAGKEESEISTALASGRGAPTLSIVVASRNDSHGGDIGQRMRFFVNGLLHQTRHAGLHAELIVVEWNPPSEKPRLREVLPRPSTGDKLQIRTVTVPEALHRRFRHGDEIPLYQMIAKNVGIRRSRADRVLCTNVDLLFSNALTEFLATGSFDPRAFYRANRCDVPDALDPNWDVPAQLEFCTRNILRRLGQASRIDGPRDPRLPHIVPAPMNPNWRYALYLRAINAAVAGVRKGNAAFDLAINHALGGAERWKKDAPPPPQHQPSVVPSPEERTYAALDMDACGDFTLMSRDAWMAIRGYVELDLYSIHVDSLALCAASAVGLKQIVLPENSCTYHLDHPSGWMSLEGIERLRFLERRPGLDFETFRQAALETLRAAKPLELNSPDWGFASHALEEHEL